MPDQLRLTLTREGDGTGELFAEVRSRGFCGSASAWFNTKDVERFGYAMRSTFPLPEDEELSLSGGLWSSSGAPSLEVACVQVGIRASGSTGNLVVAVSLVEPTAVDGPAVRSHAVHVSLQTNYEALRAFGAQVESLSQGRAEHALLVAG